MKTHIMRWCPQDWRTSRVRSRSARTGDQALRLVYLELLFAMFEAGGSLADGRQSLEDELMLPWEAIEPALATLQAMGKITREDGQVCEARVTREVEEAQAFSREQAERGQKGGLARWQARRIANAIEPEANARNVDSQPLPYPEPKPYPEPAPLPLPPPANGHDALTIPPVEDYARAVLGVYRERRGKPDLELSSLEFSLVRRWWSERIPVRVVAMGLRTCKGEGRTLMYYGPSVQEESERVGKALMR